MAAAAPTIPGEATHSLKCNTWVLKVPIHCLGCKRQVKKLLQSIDGVYTTSIDTHKQQVTVTGSINSEILVKKLSKTGKHAEVCGAKPAENAKKNEKQGSQSKEQTTNHEAKLNSKKASNPSSKTPEKTNPQKELDKVSDSPGAAETGAAGNSGKTKKGKGQKGNCSNSGNGAPASSGSVNANQGRFQVPANPNNLSPSINQLNPMLLNQGPPTVHVLSYNAAYPSKVGHGLSYQVPSPLPYISSYSTNEQIESYQVQATTFNSLDIFSDENPNGCSIV